MWAANKLAVIVPTKSSPSSISLSSRNASSPSSTLSARAGSRDDDRMYEMKIDGCASVTSALLRVSLKPVATSYWPSAASSSSGSSSGSPSSSSPSTTATGAGQTPATLRPSPSSLSPSSASSWRTTVCQNPGAAIRVQPSSPNIRAPESLTATRWAVTVDVRPSTNVTSYTNALCVIGLAPGVASSALEFAPAPTSPQIRRTGHPPPPASAPPARA